MEEDFNGEDPWVLSEENTCEAIQGSEVSSNNDSSISECSLSEFSECSDISDISSRSSSSSITESNDLPNYLDEKIIDDLIERGKQERNEAFSDLWHILDKVFSKPENLSESFFLNRIDKLGTNLNEIQVDFKSLRSSMIKLFGLNNMMINVTIHIAIAKLCETLVWHTTELELEAHFHCFVICFDLTAYLELTAGLQYSALSELCSAASRLPISYQVRLAHIWAKHCKENLLTLVRSCQRRITEILTYNYVSNIHENEDIKNATRILKIAFYANILAGDVASPKPFTRFFEDAFEIELNISVIDCHKPLIPYEEFYNNKISARMQRIDAISLDSFNFLFKSVSPEFDENIRFSFWKYSFILLPEAKITALHQKIDSRINDSKRKLKIRRDKIVDDVFKELERVCNERPKDLRQPLVVEFVNEEAIDEGGVSKEFFQVIIEKLFDNDFGLFSYQEDSKTMWFKPYLSENESKYKLVGIILGLAVMNKISLALNFPMVIFRKLLGGAGSFFDLEDWSPILYRNLKDLLDYEKNDMEECFEQTFTIGKTNVSGQVIEHELKPGGADIKVGQHNKKEFVDLYSDFVLNESIDEQFQALKSGFEIVTHVLPIRELFRPEEFELLICGSKTFDFVELQRITVYEGGYTKDTRVIQDFWSIVHAMTNEMQGKLLEFTTGSDRIPVGGLNRLQFIIQRNGSDCDWLPSSHTCFNVLLLPEYINKENLKERLLKVLNYSRGFGLV